MGASEGERDIGAGVDGLLVLGELRGLRVAPPERDGLGRSVGGGVEVGL